MILFSSCGEDVAYRIEGKLTNLEDQTVYAVFESDNLTVIDTVVCDKPGQFAIRQEKLGFNQATLFFEDKTSWFPVYLDDKKGKITITGDMHYPSLLQVKGGRINNDLSAFRKKHAAMFKEQANLYAGLKKTNGNQSMDGNDFASRLTNLNHQLSEQALEYIHDYPDRQASVVLIQTYFTDPDDTRKLDELLIALDPRLKDFYLVEELEQFSARAKRTALGAEAPDFTVKNVYGEQVSLDLSSQKYLLLSFTAPWCDMCQTEDLYLDEFDKTYSKEDLTQILVSLDDDMKGVRELLAKDSIRWNLITDSAGQAAMLIDLYNVSSVPRCFLIDDNCKIILKTESGLEVKQTLEKLIE
ncbi:MAG: AhpC/TSA family protein [Tannerellaceae bacterium]|jgi:peroxiredoxin|nr:AhpC/TSA family protein [Tannerellaceae bacterium]